MKQRKGYTKAQVYKSTLVDIRFIRAFTGEKHIEIFERLAKQERERLENDNNVKQGDF